MCNYQGHEFGADYPDSTCIDGYLWDADSCDEPGGPLTQGGEIPCPECNHEKWLARFEDELRDEGFTAAMDGETECPFDSDKPLKYESDRPVLAAWWHEGFERGKVTAGDFSRT